MLQILTVWACLHPVISYRQGMHELLAPMVKVLEADLCAHEAHAGAASDSEEEQCLAGLLQRK